MPSLHKDVKATVQSTALGQPVHELIARSTLIKQGAEALTRQRLTSEARALVRCSKAGVRVPGLRLVDVRQGCLGMEWIEGWSVREVLGGGQEEQDDATTDAAEAEAEEIGALLLAAGVDEDTMLHAVGREIGKMHLAEIIHGDLTTSNMMVRLLPGSHTHKESLFEVVLIDFGLSSASPMHEERAVDLPHFEVVLDGYRAALQGGAKKGEWERVEKRLEEVRMRGRKRSMVG
ncbi:hypothetical protein Rhopal_004971-T1 [Rhodotorula paludigena]|uniref:non-specific serine/threonine protein kinase n=1 Tax=Rhodotorula paludigena TaxID=86838 RepID=A0AAV5GTJ5_9BASI|nr:hypothetical protein Rhopal_004971-T1 [Rhodotorula paludigena]